MTTITPDQFIAEEAPAESSSEPNRALWISEAGEITVIEGKAVTRLGAGAAATFKAGIPLGHYLENRSSAATRCLVAGTRAPVDRITYPEHNRVCIRDRSLPDDEWTDLAGNPAQSPYDQ